ncbi:MAG: sensor histidine kinase [Oscillospiraceae bacterium]|nr:sensor histidine kinase [Oscillospiraceae bacterium]
MKLHLYLKDRFPTYLIGTVTWFLILIFLYTFHVSAEAAVIVTGLALVGTVLAEIWGYLRKKPFYDNLLMQLAQLDQKYLLHEMIEEPSFYEGKIICDVLRESNKSMCEQIAQYRRETEAFREYIELWVHEVKLPVASLQLISHNDGNTKYVEQLSRIDGYIENVLYYARSENAEKDYIIKPVVLQRIFTETAVKNRTELQERNITLHTKKLGMQVMTDSKWLGFIFGQLLSNSIKYQATEITVSAEDSPEKTVLHFHDNGIGIPERDLPYIFEKSFTGENGRTHAKSTGMGLYIVKKLCDKLGHDISAESEQGHYTEFRIVFGKNDLHLGNLSKM